MSTFPRGWIDKAHWLCLVLAMALAAPNYWTALRTPATGIYHDDAIYLITAKSLAEGRGYTIDSPPQPIAQTKYPVLFPALLSLIWQWQPQFPGNLLWLKLVPLVASCIWLVFSWLLIRWHTASPWLATTIVSLTVASPQVVFLSTAVLSETLFAAMFTAAMLFWWKYDGTGKPVFLSGAAFFSAAAYHTRTIGLCLVLAGLLTLAWRRKWRDALLFGLIIAALVSPWLLWQWSHRAAADPYLSQENYYTTYNVLASFSWPEKLRIIGMNFALFLSSGNPIFDLPLAMVFGWLAFPLAIRGCSSGRLSQAATLALGISFALILLWAWPPLRFVVPLLPLLLWAIAEGIPTRLRTSLLVGCWLLFAFGCYRSYQFSASAQLSGCWYPLAAPSQVWRGFESQLDWIRLHTQPANIVQSNVDPTIYLFTGRHAIRGSHGNASLKLYLDKPAPLGDSKQFAQALSKNQVGYLVETPWPWFLENPIFAGFYRELDSQLETVYSTPEGYRIYRFATAGASAK